MGEFEPDVPPHVARPLAEKTWSQKFRTYKYWLRQFMKKNVHNQEPTCIDPNIWKKFVESEGDPRKQELNNKNKRSREKLEFSHCLGRRSYAQKEYLMVKENPSLVIGRADKWLAAHEHADGTILESAKDKYEQVKAAADKRKSQSSNGDGCLDNYEDIDSDEIAEVFGKEKNGGVRAMGSHITKKHLSQIAVAKSKIQEKDKALKEATDVKSEILTRIDDLEGIIRSLYSKMDKPSYMPTSSSDLGSNSNSPPTPQLNNISDTLGVSHIPPSHTNNESPRVILCDKFGKKVARGHVVTDSTAKFCHFKTVGDDEKKVYVEEVFDPDARLWDPPKGG